MTCACNGSFRSRGSENDGPMSDVHVSSAERARVPGPRVTTSLGLRSRRNLVNRGSRSRPRRALALAVAVAVAAMLALAVAALSFTAPLPLSGHAAAASRAEPIGMSAMAGRRTALLALAALLPRLRQLKDLNFEDNKFMTC